MAPRPAFCQSSRKINRLPTNPGKTTEEIVITLSSFLKLRALKRIGRDSYRKRNCGPFEYTVELYGDLGSNASSSRKLP